MRGGAARDHPPASPPAIGRVRSPTVGPGGRADRSAPRGGEVAAGRGPPDSAAGLAPEAAAGPSPGAGRGTGTDGDSSASPGFEKPRERPAPTSPSAERLAVASTIPKVHRWGALHQTPVVLDTRQGSALTTTSAVATRTPLPCAVTGVQTDSVSCPTQGGVGRPPPTRIGEHRGPRRADGAPDHGRRPGPLPSGRPSPPSPPRSWTQGAWVGPSLTQQGAGPRGARTVPQRTRALASRAAHLIEGVGHPRHHRLRAPRVDDPGDPCGSIGATVSAA